MRSFLEGRMSMDSIVNSGAAGQSAAYSAAPQQLSPPPSPGPGLVDAARFLEDVSEDVQLKMARDKVARLEHENEKIDRLLESPRKDLFAGDPKLYEKSFETAITANQRSGMLPVAFATLLGTIGTIVAVSAMGAAVGSGLGLIGLAAMGASAFGSSKLYKSYFQKFVLPRETEKFMKMNLKFKKEDAGFSLEFARERLHAREQELIKNPAAASQIAPDASKATVDEEPDFIVVDGLKLDKKFNSFPGTIK
jgi:hypothetical protein